MNKVKSRREELKGLFVHPETHEGLKRIAAKNKRTMRGQIAWWVEREEVVYEKNK